MTLVLRHCNKHYGKKMRREQSKYIFSSAVRNDCTFFILIDYEMNQFLLTVSIRFANM